GVCATEVLATKRHKKHKRNILNTDFRAISRSPPNSFLCFMCLFVACFKNKYASGVSVDVNGIAAGTGPAILWPCAIATPASMDDCLGGLDCSRRLRRHQSHRSGASAALGTGDTARTSIRVWRLAALRVSHARRFRRLEKVVAGAPSSC